MAKKTIRQNVESILASFPASRNSDKKLILEYWRKIDNVSFKDIDGFVSGFIADSTSSESIRRARQLVQEEGRFLPTDEEVLMRRGKNSSRMREAVLHNEVI